MKIGNNIDLEMLKHFSIDNPFYHPYFLQALIQSQSLGQGTGWTPLSFSNENELSLAYIKHHSYGEYIFDWAWADLYRRVGLNYYPKLIHAIPFTPVNSPKIFSKAKKSSLLSEVKEYYLKNSELSGHHYLFSDQQLSNQLESLGYFTKYSLQYHWPNKDYNSFEEFLACLKSRKRKQIKKERKQVEESDLTIERKKFNELNKAEIQSISDLYISTIKKKHSYAYLRENFFPILLSQDWNQGFAVLAYKKKEIIAMSLFFHSDSTLFGRYWGIKTEFESDYKYLHFEMCYYYGIDFCIEKKLSLFEAGAQGEHKLLRGFNPVLIYSSHLLRNEELGKIIRHYTEQENKHILKNKDDLRQFTPYKD